MSPTDEQELNQADTDIQNVEADLSAQPVTSAPVVYPVWQAVQTALTNNGWLPPVAPVGVVTSPTEPELPSGVTDEGVAENTPSANPDVETTDSVPETT